MTFRLLAFSASLSAVRGDECPVNITVGAKLITQVLDNSVLSFGVQAVLKRLQESDQRLSVFERKFESKLVALNWARPQMKALRNIV